MLHLLEGPAYCEIKLERKGKKGPVLSSIKTHDLFIIKCALYHCAANASPDENGNSNIFSITR